MNAVAESEQEAAESGAGDGKSGVSLAFACALLIVTATFGAYWPVRDNDFVGYDDPLYVTDNAMVQAGWTSEGLRWAFDNEQTANWHPLTWLSHMTDCEFFGVDARAHHLVNVGLHALTAVLFFFAFVVLSGRLGPSLFVALLFALHPLRVESVAWIAERKDVLSGVFAAAALLFYGLWAKRGSKSAWVAVTLALALGLMAKPTLVTLPFVFLLLDLWPLRRLGPSGTEGGFDGRAVRRAVIEKLAWFGLALLASWQTYRHQVARGAVDALGDLSLVDRAANACGSLLAYVVDFVWPTGLAVFYPHPVRAAVVEGTPFDAFALFGLSLFIMGTLAACLSVRRVPLVFVSWFWFVGVLVPMLGFVQVGEQGRADRYVYLALIGLSLPLAYGLDRMSRLLRAGLATLVLVACALLTYRQAEVWADTSTLFEHALRVTERNDLAHTYVGIERHGLGDLDVAEEHYRAALAIHPTQATALGGLGAILEQKGRLPEARRQLELSLSVQPNAVETRYNLAVVLQRLGHLDEARVQIQHVLEARPQHAPALNFLGGILATGGDWPRAEKLFLLAVESDPELGDAHRNLALLYTQMGRSADAERHRQAAASARR